MNLTSEQIVAATAALADMDERAGRATSAVSGYDRLLSGWVEALSPLVEHAMEPNA